MRVALLVAVVAAGAGAADAGERFAVVDAGSVESFDRELRDHGLQGRRVVGTCRGASVDGKERFVAVLERTEPPRTVAYAAVALPGDLGSDESLERLDDLGRRGDRLLPEHLLTRPVGDWWLAPAAYEAQVVSILERGEPGSVWEYAVVPYGAPDEFHRRLDELVGRGFALLGMVNTSRRPRAILARSEGAAQVEEPYRLVLRSTNRGLRRALVRARREGYGVLDVAQPSILAPPIVVVGKTEQPVPEAWYKLMRKPDRKARRDRLERKLNARGKKGFRAVPASVSERAILFVRDERPRRRWEYRTLSSARAPGLPRALDGATRDGYRYVAMFHDAGETTVLVARPRAE